MFDFKRNACDTLISSVLIFLRLYKKHIFKMHAQKLYILTETLSHDSIQCSSFFQLEKQTLQFVAYSGWGQVLLSQMT